MAFDNNEDRLLQIIQLGLRPTLDVLQQYGVVSGLNSNTERLLLFLAGQTWDEKPKKFGDETGLATIDPNFEGLIIVKSDGNFANQPALYMRLNYQNIVIYPHTPDAPIYSNLYKIIKTDTPPTSGQFGVIYFHPTLKTMKVWNGTTYLTKTRVQHMLYDYYATFSAIDTSVYDGVMKDVIVVEDETNNNYVSKYFFEGTQLVPNLLA
jgi:hypothetical protein